MAKRQQPRILEMFSQYVKRIEQELARPRSANKTILLSTDVRQAILKEDLGIQKRPIVWPLYNHNMFYIVNVPVKTRVPAHLHDEDVFRYVISGSFTINNIKVEQGMWCVVRKGVRYRIVTETGYTALSAYTSICRTNRGAGRAPFA